MFNNAERKLDRMGNVGSMQVSENIYNLVLGATVWYGLVCNAFIVQVFAGKLDNLNPVFFLIAYFVSCMLGCVITYSSHNPFISFIGYNFVVIPIGIVLAICIPNYPTESILLAARLTAIVVSVMMILATLKPHLFAGLGRTLFLSLFFGLLAEIGSLLLGYRGDFFNWFFVILFSAYIGYDWYRAQEYPKNLDNAVDSALDIYLDIINLFLRILSLLGNSKSKN